jgi:hypothetical protein
VLASLHSHAPLEDRSTYFAKLSGESGALRLPPSQNLWYSQTPDPLGWFRSTAIHRDGICVWRRIRTIKQEPLFDTLLIGR